MVKQVRALAALAEFDPDTGVRASAAQFLARLAESHDAAPYAALVRVAGRDESVQVRVSAVSNLRADAPAELKRQLEQLLHDRSDELWQEFVGRVLAWSPDVRSFVRRMSRERPAQIAFALASIVGREPPVDWANVESVAGQAPPVLNQMVLLFGDRPDAAPLSFWLRCTKHLGKLVEGPDDVLCLATDTTTSACEARRPGPLSTEEQDLLDGALSLLSQVLPAVYHTSYLELLAAGVVKNPHAPPSHPLQHGVSRLWAALIRLTPRPTDYVLRSDRERPPLDKRPRAGRARRAGPSRAPRGRAPSTDSAGRGRARAPGAGALRPALPARPTSDARLGS
ncbi:MAG TPA: hypothetical protein VFS43_24100 [Polyangiaceae bacterium]|nr:hypothetical protein [Polyangiaceae bacterium]